MKRFGIGALLVLSLSLVSCCPKEGPMALALEPSYEATLTGPELKIYRSIGEAVGQRKEPDPFVDTRMDLAPYRDRLLRLAHLWLYDHPEAGAFFSKPSLLLKEGRYLAIQETEPGDGPIPESVYLELAENFQDGSPNERAREAFCYLARTCTYDTEREGSHPDDDRGPVLDKKGCCQGFSFAYQRLLTAMGIPCQVLTCRTAAGSYHMLNAVYLDGSWMLCDAASASGEPWERGQLHYFCMPQSLTDQFLSTFVYLPIKEGDSVP